MGLKEAIEELISDLEMDLTCGHGYVDPDELDLARDEGSRYAKEAFIRDLKSLLQNEAVREHQAAIHWINKIADKMEETK